MEGADLLRLIDLWSVSTLYDSTSSWKWVCQRAIRGAMSCLRSQDAGPMTMLALRLKRVP